MQPIADSIYYLLTHPIWNNADFQESISKVVGRFCVPACPIYAVVLSNIAPLVYNAAVSLVEALKTQLDVCIYIVRPGRVESR